MVKHVSLILDVGKQSPTHVLPPVCYRFRSADHLRSIQGKGIFTSSSANTAVHLISQTTLQRHRMIYTALSDELAQGLHALSLKTTTSEEARRLAAGQAQ